MAERSPLWRERSIALPSGATHVLERGAGSPLIWTHALFHPSEVEDHTPLGAMLEAITGHRVIRHDTRGQGRSAPGLDVEAYVWSSLGDDVRALAHVAGGENAVLGGASMGAVASLYAALAGDRLPTLAVRGLILVIPPTAWATRPRQSAMYRALSRLLGQRGVSGVVDLFEQFLSQTVTPGFEDARPALLANLRGMDAAALDAVLRASAASDLPPPETLAAITAPALIVAVEDDPGHPRATAEVLAEHLPNATLQIWKRLEAPQLSAAVHDFLGRLRP